ncbi:MAG: adenylate/guanylate cyclase domain-containing protein [Rhizobiaceae bacterium]|nr:adenylate/guanylate cyclase domain-containing protein [Rhizobiaceae bacterium]
MSAPPGRERNGRAALRLRGLAALALLATIVAMLVSLTPPWRLLDARTFDYLSTLSPPPLPEAGPIVVAIDEPSLAEIGLQWPWPRDLHARLVESLRAAGAKAVGLDIIFAEPSQSPTADAALAASMGPDVVLAADETIIENEHAAQRVRVEPLPTLTEAGAIGGIASISLDPDGVFRKLPTYPDGFALGLLRAAGTAAAEPEEARLAQVFGPARTYPTVSYYQALDPTTFLPDGYFRDRVAIVGLSLQNAPQLDAGNADAKPTAYTVHTGRLVAGVEIQATVYDNILHRLAVRPAGTGLILFGTILAALLGALLVRRRTDWRTLILAFAGLAAIAACAFASLRFGRVFVPPLAPSLAFAIVASGQATIDYAVERRLRRGIVRAFSQYLAPALVEKLASDPSQLRLGGETRELTILFCDVRGFTTISESMKDDPQRLTALINRLLTPLSDVVLAAGGTIDKYIGDCLMAFWNAPLDDKDHAVHAVEAALGMLDAVEQVNRDLQAEAAGRPVPELRIGIGINTGECVVGNMGSERRFDYSVLGDSVNLASRMEGASKDVGVPLLLGEATAAAIGRRMTLLQLARIKVKGRAAPVVVYTTCRGLEEQDAAAHRDVLDRATPSSRATELVSALQADHPMLTPYYARLFAGEIERP